MSGPPRKGERRRPGGRRSGDTVARLLDGPPLVQCHHCGSNVPTGDFCGRCGAHLVMDSATRRHAFAATPSEPVLHLSIITTLFPHLPHRRGGAFQWALLAGVAAVVILAALDLFAPATATATFLLPVLYLLYLYEVEVYGTEPWLVIGATMVTGGILGFAFTTVAGGTVSHLDITGDSRNSFLLSAVAIPIAAQGLMLAGPLFLYQFRSRFREPLDGLTFGAASALGFTLGTTLTAIWPVIVGPLIGTGAPLDWALRLLRDGILVSLINASTTGLVTASVWLRRFDRRTTGRMWQVSVLATIVVAVGSQVVLGVLSFLLTDLVSQVVVLALATLALFLYVRLVIHVSLLAEGTAHEIGPDAPCPECHRVVPTMLFCPACGVARSAAPKPGRHRVGGTA